MYWDSKPKLSFTWMFSWFYWCFRQFISLVFTDQCLSEIKKRASLKERPVQSIASKAQTHLLILNLYSTLHFQLQTRLSSLHFCNTCAIDCISIVVRFWPLYTSCCSLAVWANPWICPSFSHAHCLVFASSSSQTDSSLVLCGWFRSHEPQTGQPETIFYHWKKSLGKKGCLPWSSPWWWQRGKKNNVEPSTALCLVLRVQTCIDCFSWGHHVLNNNYLCAMPYRGMFTCCQMSATLLWSPVLPSTCGPNLYLLCTGLFPAVVYGCSLVLISYNQGYFSSQTSQFLCICESGYIHLILKLLVNR